MTENYNSQRIFYRNNYQNLVIFATIGILIGFISSYISGIEAMRIYYIVIDWISNLAIALLVSKLCAHIRIYSKKSILIYLPYIVLIPPLFYSMDFLFVKENIDNYRFMEIFYTTASLISGIIQVFVAVILMKELNESILIPAQDANTFKIKTDIQQETNKKATTEKLFKEANEQQLGKGTSILDKVITSILARANSSSRAISFTLVIMLVIVAIGGSASFGTVALSEAKKVRELEAERLKMLDIVNTIQTANSAKLDERNKKLQEIIYSRYGNENTYKSIIENIEKQSYVSWPDIAMRITIAALTLFLVQIFFHIYKYNQQQASHLFTRAEILELYKEAGADQSELRLGLLAKVDSSPKFDKEPSTPTEQFINVISKAKDVK